MSPDLRTRVSVAVVGLAVAALAGGCGSNSASKAGGAVPDPSATRVNVMADATTAKLAGAEAARLCAVATQRFATEKAITEDLDRRLAAVGLTHAQWKSWHDELVTSPSLATQFSAVGKPC